MTEKRLKLVTRQQPHIVTLPVSVQVVRIGPRDITPALYRQLYEENIVDAETGELRGVPWGTVHYFGLSCAPEVQGTDHYHVVWQQGEALRRCCFPLEAPQAALALLWQEHLEEIEALPQLFIAV